MVSDLQPYQSAEHQPFRLGEGVHAALLIHGFPGTPAEVRPIATVLAQLGWRVSAPLLPGFGTDIVNLNQCRYSDWIDSAKREWQLLQDTTPSRLLVGYSMGAAVAMHLAAQSQPERLVLISPRYGGGGHPFVGGVTLPARLVEDGRKIARVIWKELME